MAQQDKITISAVDESNLLVKTINAKHPFVKPMCLISKKFVVGTDFTSGRGIDLEINGATGSFFTVVQTENSGAKAILGFTETVTSPAKLTIATATSTTNIVVFVWCKLT